MKVGFVGVGRMGANMARRLNDVGEQIVAIYDTHAQAAEEVASELSAAACATLEDVTAKSDVVFTVVTDDAAMLEIFDDRDDSLLDGAEGKIFVNCATISPGVHIDIADRARRRGASAIEACMASSIPQARNGTLYLMCAGDRDAFERVRPLLEKLAASIRYVGRSGEAAKVKALVNMLMNINTAGLAEALGLGHALGLDIEMLREVFAQTGAASRVLETDGADMQMREHETYFSAEHAAKDSGIALALADEAGLVLPLARATKAQYDRMVALGIGGLDKSGIAELTFQGRATER
ncbi:MAG TPA: NAD(P)-dependent oxidoreductase [Candidatus Binatia bacterium]|nr:NAD(P)-dependent oxidoreductase [Candidatus Binatia bacterium]